MRDTYVVSIIAYDIYKGIVEFKETINASSYSQALSDATLHLLLNFPNIAQIYSVSIRVWEALEENERREISMKAYMKHTSQTGISIITRKSILTKRELDVARCIVNGLTGNETAQKLGISYNTVVIHSLSLRRKFRVSSQIHLIRELLKSGEISISEFLEGGKHE